jgi:hypothetical protein
MNFPHIYHVYILLFLLVPWGIITIVVISNYLKKKIGREQYLIYPPSTINIVTSQMRVETI